MVIGEDEYKTELTLPAFARQELEPRGFQVQRSCTPTRPTRTTFPAWRKPLLEADLVLISVRRRTPPNEQLDCDPSPSGGG